MALKFANFARSTIATTPSPATTGTSLTVAAGQGSRFPTLGVGDYFYAVMVRRSDNAKEIVKVTARSTDTMTIVRAQEGTTGLTFTTGDYFENRLTAEQLAEFSSVPDGSVTSAKIASPGPTWDGSGNVTTSGTGHTTIAAGTTAQRPGSPAAGMVRYNSTLGRFEGYGSSWGSFGAATGGGSDAIFYENEQTVTADYTVAGTKNAMSAGPITIDTGVTVTISTGGTWVIV